MAKETSKKKKLEYSKIACIILSIALFAVGVHMIYRYFALVEMAIQMESSVQPDSALPIAGITFILAPFVSYLTYQFGLKNSRNKYGVDENGEPYKRLVE